MSGVGGWMAGWPLQWGGGETPTEKAYAALLAVVGKGHPADQDGAEWAWREARAVGLSMVEALGERAASQLYPESSPEMAAFRRRYIIPESVPDGQARVEAAKRLRDSSRGVIAEIEAELREIDGRFSILTADPFDSTATEPGRPFGDAAEPFNLGRDDSLWPAFSTSFLLVVLFDIGASEPTTVADRDAEARARRVLDAKVQTWSDYVVVTSIGFVTGVSPLGYTALTA